MTVADSSVVVSGPGCEGRSAPSVGAGVSLAQTLAWRAGCDCAFYVRDAAGGPLARVERHDRTLLTFQTGAADAPRPEGGTR